MTVSRLTAELTQEELVAWGAFFEIKRDQEEQVMGRAKAASAFKSIR